MLGIAGLVWGMFALLGWAARKEEAPKEISALLKPFYRIALFLYKKWSLHFPGLPGAQTVERDLARLHPGEALTPLKTEYYVKKMALCLAVIAVGTLFGVAVRVKVRNDVWLAADGTVTRGEYAEGARELNVTAKFGQQELDFQLQVEPRKLNAREVEEAFEQLLEKLPRYILGENESLMQVTSNLSLEENYEEFPMELEWDSDRPDILSRAGRVQPVERAENVILTVQMRYG